MKVIIFPFLGMASVASTDGDNINTRLSEINAHLVIKLNRYDNSLFNKLIHAQTVLPVEQQNVSFLNSSWKIRIDRKPASENSQATDITATLTCTNGSVKDAAVSVGIEFDDWSVKNYVLMPGAAYNGNRYTSRRIEYSPKLYNYKDIGPDKDIILSDVPKLNERRGPSFIQQRSGDMTTPSIGFYNPKDKRASFCLPIRETVMATME